MPAVDRRHLLAGSAGALAAGALAGCSHARGPGGATSSSPSIAAPGGSSTAVAPVRDDVTLAQVVRARRTFRGEHQPGIVDVPQQHCDFVALDLAKDADITAVKRLMTLWTDDIEHLMGGRASVADFEPEMTADAASLTVTVGVGPRVPALRGARGPRPGWLAPLPAFAIDRLDPAFCGGDLLLQICADSAVAVSHARWVLTKEARGIASVRWVQRGFRPPVDGPGGTMRNLFGQVDGVVQAPETAVWIDDGPAWLRGGSSFVLRRIAMNLDTWEEADPQTRDFALGRRQSDGAPLTGHAVGDVPDLTAVDRDGLPVIDPSSHMARAMPARPGERILRRPYSYDDAPAPGHLSNAGLLFCSYQASIGEQFLPIQRRLAEADLLNTWTTPVGSAVFAVPRGARPGEVLAQDLWA